jgi:CarD family transcriptional regulator
MIKRSGVTGSDRLAESGQLGQNVSERGDNVFDVGDKVFHPVHGAGIVVEVKERRSLGKARRYYSIELLSQPKTLLMVPVGGAQEIGLRASISQSQLRQVWGVLRADPETLPTDHEQRYELLKDRMRGGDALQIAAALRDMAWREDQERRLTKQGKRLYDESLMLLAGEIAIIQDSDMSTAEAQIMDTLRECVAPGPAI